MVPLQSPHSNDVSIPGELDANMVRTWKLKSLVSSLRRLVGRSPSQRRDPPPESPTASPRNPGFVNQQGIKPINKDCSKDANPLSSKVLPRPSTSVPLLVPEAPFRSIAWVFPKLPLARSSTRKSALPPSMSILSAATDANLRAPPLSTGAMADCFTSGEINRQPVCDAADFAHDTYGNSPVNAGCMWPVPSDVTRQSGEALPSCSWDVSSSLSPPPIIALQSLLLPSNTSLTTSAQPVSSISSVVAFTSALTGSCSADGSRQYAMATAAATATATSAAAATTAVAAADGGPTSTLLAMCPSAPQAMHRPLWRISDYVIGGRLYKGEVSSVYKAVCRFSGLKVVLKVYSLSRVADNALHTLVREVRIHRELAHESILILYGVFEEDNRLVLVLERAMRGDLLRLHRSIPNCRMSEDQLRVLVLAPLLDALVYLHSRGVCHRDIKPENLLMTASWQLRLADFGAAINLFQERAVTRTGTMEYMAPEVERCPLKLLPEDNKDNVELAYSTAADVWSVGVLAYEMLVGFPPFINCTRAGAGTGAGLIVIGSDSGVGGGSRSRELCFPHFVSAGGQDFITCALAERPMDRLTAVQLQRHPWLKHAVRQHQFNQQQLQQEQLQGMQQLRLVNLRDPPSASPKASFLSRQGLQDAPSRLQATMAQ